MQNSAPPGSGFSAPRNLQDAPAARVRDFLSSRANAVSAAISRPVWLTPPLHEFDQGRPPRPAGRARSGHFFFTQVFGISSGVLSRFHFVIARAPDANSRPVWMTPPLHEFDQGRPPRPAGRARSGHFFFTQVFGISSGVLSQFHFVIASERSERGDLPEITAVGRPAPAQSSSG